MRNHRFYFLHMGLLALIIVLFSFPRRKTASSTSLLFCPQPHFRWRFLALLSLLLLSVWVGEKCLGGRRKKLFPPFFPYSSLASAAVTESQFTWKGKRRRGAHYFAGWAISQTDFAADDRSTMKGNDNFIIGFARELLSWDLWFCLFVSCALLFFAKGG